MIYVWNAAVMAAAGYVLYRTLIMANNMSPETSHIFRAATLLLAVVSLGELLAIFAGRVPELAEGFSIIGVAAFMACNRRRLNYAQESRMQRM